MLNSPRLITLFAVSTTTALLLLAACSCNTEEDEKASGNTVEATVNDNDNTPAESVTQPETEILKPQPDAAKPAQGLAGILEIAGKLRELDRHEAVRLLAGYLDEETKVAFFYDREIREKHTVDWLLRELVSLESDRKYLKILLGQNEDVSTYSIVLYPEFTKPVLNGTPDELFEEFREYVAGLENLPLDDAGHEILLGERKVMLKDHGIWISMGIGLKGHHLTMARYDQNLDTRRSYPLVEYSMDDAEGTEAFLRAFLPTGSEVFEFSNSRDTIYFTFLGSWDELQERFGNLARDAGLVKDTGEGELQTVGLVGYKSEDGRCTLSLIKSPSENPVDWEYALAYSQEDE